MREIKYNKIDSVDDVRWVDLSEIPDLAVAFDHKHIIEKAKARLQQKALYSMIPVYCLPDQFTISTLTQVPCTAHAHDEKQLHE